MSKISITGEHMHNRGFNNWHPFFNWLKGTGFDPKIIFDVGVATDTEELYFHFPNSRYVFVEPLEEFKDNLNALANKYNGVYVMAAAGPSEGELELQVTSDLGGTSIFTAREAQDPEFNKVLGQPLQVPRKVPMVTLDTIWNSLEAEGGFKPEGPGLLKVDVQGGELEVIKGAQTCLDNFEVVILEVNYLTGYVGSPIFDEYIAYMSSRGYVVLDIIHSLYTDVGMLTQSDVVFAKRDGILRQNQKTHNSYEIAKGDRLTNYKGITRK